MAVAKAVVTGEDRPTATATADLLTCYWTTGCKKTLAKFSEESSAWADQLNIGCLSQWANKFELFFMPCTWLLIIWHEGCVSTGRRIPQKSEMDLCCFGRPVFTSACHSADGSSELG